MGSSPIARSILREAKNVLRSSLERRMDSTFLRLISFRFEWHATLQDKEREKAIYFFDMYYVYIIRSRKDDRQIYTGFTADLKQRIDDHNNGNSIHTKKYIPWTLEFYSAFIEKEKALEFERYLKSGSGIAFRNKRFLTKKE